MIPATFVLLDELPVTSHGKADREALPKVGLRRPEHRLPPRSRQEEQLRGLFAEVLGVPDIGINEDFFDLGGNSILATRLVSLIPTELRPIIKIRNLYETPTIAELATLLG